MQYKISGILNNCALNTALPIILADIKDLAAIEKRGLLPDPKNLGKNGIEEKTAIRSDEPYYNKYFLLKEIFCEIYNLDNDTFTWKNLDEFLSGFHSFLVSQVIFLPVFRKFIGEIAPLQGYTDLEQLINIQEVHKHEYDKNCVGRYPMLDAREAYNLFHSQFGIKINTCHEESGMPGYVENHIICASSQCFCPHWVKTITNERRCINVFLRNDHFEITELDAYSEAVTQYNKELDELQKDYPQLKNIIEYLSSSDSADNTNNYLGGLKLYVHKQLINGVSEKESKSPIIESQEFNKLYPPDTLLEHYKKQGEKSYSTFYNDKPADSICYTIFSSVYFKIFMACIIITAALTLTALILSHTNLQSVIPAFLTDLPPIIYKTIFGASIGGGSVATIGFAGSFMASNKACVFNDDCDFVTNNNFN